VAVVVAVAVADEVVLIEAVAGVDTNDRCYSKIDE